MYVKNMSRQFKVFLLSAVQHSRGMHACRSRNRRNMTANRFLGMLDEVTQWYERVKIWLYFKKEFFVVLLVYS